METNHKNHQGVRAQCFPDPTRGRGHKERVHAKTPASTLQMSAVAPGILALVQWAGLLAVCLKVREIQGADSVEVSGRASGSPRNRDTAEELQREQSAQARARCQGGTYSKGLRTENEIEPPVSLPAPCWL